MPAIKSDKITVSAAGAQIGAEDALALMFKGKVVQRISKDGTSGKFMRCRLDSGLNEIESAKTIGAFVNGVWERASTDIATFFESHYRVVSRVRGINPEITMKTDRLTLQQVIPRMKNGEVFQRIGCGEMAGSFHRMIGNEMQVANEEGLLDGAWKRAATDISSFCTSRFILVSEISATETLIEFETRIRL